MTSAERLNAQVAKTIESLHPTEHLTLWGAMKLLVGIGAK